MGKTQQTASTTVAAPIAVMKPISLSFGEKMLAGAIARGVAQSVLHPVDVLRTRLQARGVKTTLNPSIFIKGIIPQTLLAIPAGAIQFLAFETAKEKLVKWFPDDNLKQARVLLAGAFGAATAATFRVPQELLKQRIQADIYPNFITALRETLFKQGFGSLYKGALATLSRDVPWNALSFMFHSQAKTMFERVKGRAPANDENLVLAGVSGAIAAVIMTPIDVVKTRIMTESTSMGIVSTLKDIIANEGAGTLMKGVIPRIVFLAPLAGITFSVYEAVAAELRKRKSTPVTSSSSTTTTTSSASRQGHPYQHLGAFALRFAKTPVRVANGKLSRGRHGQYIGDYEPISTRFVFSAMTC